MIGRFSLLWLLALPRFERTGPLCGAAPPPSSARELRQNSRKSHLFDLNQGGLGKFAWIWPWWERLW